MAFFFITFSLSAFDEDTLFLCQGDGINYESIQKQGVAVAWEWTFQGGSYAKSNEEKPSKTVVYDQVGLFRTYIKTTFDDGSMDFDTLAVLVSPSSVPSFSFPSDTGYCLGTAFDFTLETVNAQGLKYLWSTGQTTPSILISNKGSYWVDVVMKSGPRTCDSVRKYVNVSEFPSPSVNLGQDQFMCQNQVIDLDAGAGNNYKYLWAPNNEITRLISVSMPGQYSVTVTNEYGCKASDAVLLQDSCPHYVFIPNAVYPNGDRLNDVFIKVMNFTPLESTFYIFDKWGELLFESNDLNSSWDCTFEGETVPQDIYVYRLIYKDNDKKWYEFRGTFSVLR